MRPYIPNLLTLVRLALTLVVFFALILVPFDTDGYVDDLYLNAFSAFVIAAVTDFFDGYLARKWKVESTFGAIMDPIADKVLICAAIVGLAVAKDLVVGIFGGLMLFREFAVSAMREVLAPRGLKLPVTFLAKIKTTVQLVALAFSLFTWTRYSLLLGDPRIVGIVNLVLMFVATVITLWTGIAYGLAARKALKTAA